MLMATDLLTQKERQDCLRLIPWRHDIQTRASEIRATFANNGLSLIDAALGPNHLRAALVAIHEGMDFLLESSIDLADSVARERFFARVQPLDPLGEGPLTSAERIQRIPMRFAKYAVEDAAIRTVTAGDHFANAHIRLAWEANAASCQEVQDCRFDPTKDEPRSWITITDLQRGLKKAAKKPLGILSSFVANSAFHAFLDDPVVEELRRYRHAVLHRARPSYREDPAFGRTSLWSKPSFTIRFPPPSPGEEVQSINDFRDLVAHAISATFKYGVALWKHTVLFLQSVDVPITTTEGQVEVITRFAGTLRYPRENRDPGPFLEMKRLSRSEPTS